MVVHPRVSGVQDTTDAAFEDVELCEEVEVADEAGADDAVDGAAVDAKESVTLSSAQNCWARLSAEGTLALQFAATQVYKASGNTLSRATCTCQFYPKAVGEDTRRGHTEKRSSSRRQ